MKTIAIAVLTIAIIAGGTPVAAQPQTDRGTAAEVQAVVPAGTVELGAYTTTLRKTLNATWRNWEQLRKCRTWACYLDHSGRIDIILTRGIQWMYQHPALPCYQAQQERATKGLQELRGGFRMLVKAVGTGAKWRIRVATQKIKAAGQIFNDLPVQTCPA